MEVWGWQVEGGRASNGNSTYVVDGAPPFKNAKLPTTTATAASMLFSTSGLDPGPHTLSVVNVGVHIAIWYFKTQNPASSIGSPSPPDVTASSPATLSTPLLTPSSGGPPPTGTNAILSLVKHRSLSVS